MTITLCVILGLLALSVHELGHYEAMRRCGIAVKEVGLIGLPLPHVPSLRFKAKGTTWSIHPLILGAFVSAKSEDDMERLSLWDKLYISSNGITANLAYGVVLIFMASAYAHLLVDHYDQAFYRLAAGLGLGWLIWLGRRFMAIALPIFSIPILCLTAYGLFSIGPSEAVNNGAGGPVAVALWFGGAGTVSQAFFLAGFLSVNLGIINLLPLPPLDGGRMASDILERFCGPTVGKMFLWLGVPAFLFIILYSLGLDVLRIWKWIW